jgi:hypothetical protein
MHCKREGREIAR